MIDITTERLPYEIDCFEGGLEYLRFRDWGDNRLWYGKEMYVSYSKQTGLFSLYSYKLNAELTFLETSDVADFIRLNLHLLR